MFVEIGKVYHGTMLIFAAVLSILSENSASNGVAEVFSPQLNFSMATKLHSCDKLKRLIKIPFVREVLVELQTKSFSISMAWKFPDCTIKVQSKVGCLVDLNLDWGELGIYRSCKS